MFHGIAVQHGRGLGNLLNAAFRMIAPGLKSAGKAVLKQGVSTGANILSDVLGGESLKSSAKRRAVEGGDALMGKALARAGLVPPPPKRRRRRTTQRSGGGGRRGGVVGIKKRGRRRGGLQSGGGRGTVRRVRKQRKRKAATRRVRKIKLCVRRKGRKCRGGGSVSQRRRRRVRHSGPLMGGRDIFSH